MTLSFRKVRSTVALVSVLTISLFAFGQSKVGHATGTYTVTHEGLVFDAGSSGEYSLSAVTTHTAGVAKGRYTIPFKDSYDNTNSNVLGREKNGSLTLSLSQSDGGAQLTVDIAVDDAIKDRPIQTSTSYVVDLTFTEGTWDDYAAGNDVTLAPTLEGAKAYENGMGQLMLDIFTKALVGGVKKIDIKTNIESVLLTEVPSIKANLAQIQIPRLVTTYVFSAIGYSKPEASAGADIEIEAQ